MDPSTAVSTNPQSGLLYHIDMAKGKILLKADKTFFPVIDNMIKWVSLDSNVLHFETESCHDANIVVAGGTGGCGFDNLPCRQ